MELITVRTDSNKNLVIITKSTLIPKRRPPKVNKVKRKKMIKQSIKQAMLKPRRIKLENR